MEGRNLMNQASKPLSSKERKHIETIQRRVDYLGSQLANSKYGNMDFSRREISALNWAIKALEGAAHER
jgi:hypothetical protein